MGGTNCFSIKIDDQVVLAEAPELFKVGTRVRIVSYLGRASENEDKILIDKA